MITKWRVNNFKSIREDTELNMAPLTIFSGANSSGKSTLIQSILLIAQTLSNKIGTRSVVLNGSLAALGKFDDLKSSDSQSNEITIAYTCKPTGNKSRYVSDIDYSLSSPRRVRLQEVLCEISFSGGKSDDNSVPLTNEETDFYQMQPQLSKSRVVCQFMARDKRLNQNNQSNQNNTLSLEVSRSELKTKPVLKNIEENKELEDAFSYEVKFDSSFKRYLNGWYKSAKPIGCRFHHFLPQKILFSVDPNEQIAKGLIHYISDPYSLHYRYSPIDIREVISIEDKIPSSVINVLHDYFSKNEIEPNYFSENSSEGITFEQLFKKIEETGKHGRRIPGLIRDENKIFQKIYDILKKESPFKNKEPILKVNSAPQSIIEFYEYLDNFFTRSFRYLGPLRDSPKAVYPLMPSIELDDIGLKGERTASMLESHKNQQVEYIPSKYFGLSNNNKTLTSTTLEKAVIDWLKYLNIANSIKSRDKGKFGHELQIAPSQVKNSSDNYDLTHVGVGVSQVLPILVMGLLAGEDSTLVFEQPELHLHPSVQSLLGDFFLSMAMCNKQCIVETHSEHLINRLRLNIANAKKEKDEKKLLNLTKIYFVENFSGTSQFKEVKINEYGTIVNWPKGFFDESVRHSEKILKASLEKRKSKTQKN